MRNKAEGLTMKLQSLCALGITLAIILLLPVTSWAHGFAGKRFFPTTFQVDDPFISDEFSILINRVKQAGDEPNMLTQIDIDYSKRIIPNFGLEFHEAYMHLGSNGDGSANGWDNLGIGAKWQFLTNAEHELILSVGTDIDIGGTGAHQIADSFSTISPALFFGKGLNEFPESLKYLRPFAEIPADERPPPRDQTLRFGQYGRVFLRR